MTKSLNEGNGKGVFIGLLILNVLFFAYWAILAFYSRPHYDDLHFLWKLREMSIIDYIKDMYISRSGRFVAYGINGIIACTINWLGFHQLWAIIFYILGITICFESIKDIDLHISRIEKFNVICLVYNLYILTNIDFPVFFWLCAMSYYLCFPIACLTLKYLNKDRLNWREWIALLLSAVFLGGGNEAFTPIFLLLSFACGMHWWKSQNWDIKQAWQVPQVKRIVWVTLFVLTLFAIVVIAPGNYERMSDTEQFIHPRGFIGWIRGLVEAIGMFCYFMAFYIPYYLVLFTVSFFIGTRKQKDIPCKKQEAALCIITCFGLYLLISCIPNVYLYGGFGIQRTYTHVVGALLLSICMGGYILGNGHQMRRAGRLSITGIVFLLMIMIINIYRDVPTAKNYATAVDKRTTYLCEMRDRMQKDTITVPALPTPYTEDAKHFILGLLGHSSTASVIYYISDTDIEPNEYEYHLKKLLGLNYDFVLESSTNK